MLWLSKEMNLKLINTKFQITQNPMERDLELFQEFDNSNSSEVILFFYTWETPAITLGKIQKQKPDVIQEASRLGLPYYVRPTGGRAVLHGGDICYTFIAPQSHKEFGGPLKLSFKRTNQIIKTIINKVFNCEILEATYNTPNPSYNCFSSTITNEGVIYTGNKLHKIIGSAQALGKRSFIQQGSIQLNNLNLDSELFQASFSLSQITRSNYDLDLYADKLNMLTKNIINS